MRQVLAILAGLVAWWAVCAGYGAWSRTWDDVRLAGVWVFPVAALSMVAGVLAFRLVQGKRTQ